MCFAIYGKRTCDWYDSKHNFHEADKTFAAIDGHGNRVTQLKDALTFPTKESAQEYLDSKTISSYCAPVFEIRKLTKAQCEKLGIQ